MNKLNYSLVAKLTERCDLNCSYCYLNEKQNKDMSIDTIEDLIESFFDKNEDYTHFTWIGGEPLLREDSVFEKIMEFSKKYSTKKSIPYSHSIQTNGTRLNEKRFNYLKSLGFKIGVSYDGCPEIQNIQRGTPEKNKIILQNISNANKGLGLLGVLTKNSVGKVRDIYEFFQKHTDFAKINFYSPTGSGLSYEKELLPSKEEAKEMILEFYNLWKKDESNFTLRPHRDIVRSFFTGIPLTCENSAISCYKIVASDTEGNIYNCSRAMHMPEMKIGNIKERLENILGNDVHNVVLKRYLELKEKTNDPWFNLSAGGCPIEAISHKGNVMAETYYSGEVRNALFEKINEDLKDERTRKKLEKKSGLI